MIRFICDINDLYRIRKIPSVMTCPTNTNDQKSGICKFWYWRKIFENLWNRKILEKTSLLLSIYIRNKNRSKKWLHSRPISSTKHTRNKQGENYNGCKNSHPRKEGTHKKREWWLMMNLDCMMFSFSIMGRYKDLVLSINKTMIISILAITVFSVFFCV